MKILPTLSMAVVLAVAVGTANAQEGSPPSLVVAPWGGSAPNMAAEISAGVVEAVDSLDRFERIEWDALLDSFRVTRDMSPTRRAGLGCIQGRQVAVAEGIDYVLCGSLRPTPEGILLELEIYDIGSGSTIELEPLVAQELELLVEHAVRQVRGWAS